ncbi:sensor histidine kinase [Thermus oshimai]|uniref:sensor histidine kinase n=1 Tax=Thermus oshimai TaxID=56957 RepID=UPI0003781B34|nr:sensor histidine kinase [Thermus oshimai]
MDCTPLAQALLRARTRQESLRLALEALEAMGVIRCGEAYWVTEGLRLVQLQSCRKACLLVERSRALAEQALAGERAEEGPLVALPIRDEGRTLAVLVLSLEEGEKVPEALKPLLLLALKRPSLEASSRLLLAQEEERRRVGRELHDGVGSLLTATLLTLKLAERHPERLPEVRAQLAQALEEVRRLSRELRMPLLDEFSLEEALRRYLEGYRRQGLQVEARLAVPPMDKVKEAALFRVVQEALTNVLKHAGAKRVRVELLAEGERLFGVIEDDGKGFDPHKTPPSVGLLGMQERVQALGGSLFVHSQPGEGTRVEFGVPL